MLCPDIADRTYWDGLRNDGGVRGKMAAVIVAQAEALPEVPTLPTASEFLANKRTGNRGLIDDQWAARDHALRALVLRRCLLGMDAGTPDQPADDRLLNWLFAHASQPTWVMSAHLGHRDLPMAGEGQFDLASCEMAACLATAAALLKPWLDTQSNTLCATIIEEVERRTLRSFAEVMENGDPPWWADAGHDVNNWSGVCGGGIAVAVGALETLGEQHDTAKRHAMSTLDLYLHRGFTESGECDEGLGYWGFGLQWACAAWMRMEPAEFRKAVDLPRLRQVAGYPGRAWLYGDTYYASNDAAPRFVPPLDFCPWLAAVTDDDWLRDRCATQVKNDPHTAGQLVGHVRELPGTLSMLQAVGGLAAASTRPATRPATAPALGTRYLADQQAWIAPRGRWVVTLAGGDNAESHNHNDLGHVNIYVDETPVFVDLGNLYYTGDYFGAKRYAYLAAGSQGHNVPIFNGQTQRKGNHAAGKVVERSDDRFALDLSSAYPPEAKLKSWQRSADLDAQRLVIADTLAMTGDTTGSVELRWWTPIKPTVQGERVDIGPVVMHMQPGWKATVRTERGGDHRLRQYPDDTPIYCVEVTGTVDGNATVRTEFTLR